MKDKEDEARIKAYMAAKMAHIKMYNECTNLADGLDVEKFAELVRADEREKVAHEALDRMVAESQRLGLYDATPPEVTPEVTPQVTTEVPCKTHPDAPHGFNRNASFDEDRYVCDCEFWEPDVDKVDMSEKRVHKTDKSIHELDLEAPLTVNGVPLYPKKEWVGLSVNEARKFYEKYTNREELIYAIDKFLEEKNS